MPRVVDQAICLRHWDWSETSQIAWLLTREHGVVRGVAKGAKREKAAFSGGLELATRGELVFIPKHDALSTLASWDLQETYLAAHPGAAPSARAFFAAMYLLDLAQHFVQEGDPHPPVFDALALTLRLVGDATTRADEEPVARRPILLMQWTCLDQAGLRPMLDRSAESGQPLRKASSYALSPALGGLIADPGADAPPSLLRVRAATIALLRRLDTDPPPDHAEALTILGAASDEDADRAARLLHRYAQHVLGRQLNSGVLVFGPT
ncbi:MAG: DNA repair protein RecO [Phycisphaerales bacterium]|nr:DNA repair protein RecO [Phycisphaerales bacterium]